MEVLIAVAVMIIIAGISGVYLNTLYGAKRAENSANQIIAFLTTAQEKSASQEDNSRWGVFFDAPSTGIQTYTLYRVDEGLVGSNPPFDQDNIIRRVSLPDGLKFTTPAANATLSITFERVTGLPTTAQTIRIIDDRATDNPQTIEVSTTGRIESSVQ
jgi:Tfp pilus assembly protein FimT